MGHQKQNKQQGVLGGGGGGLSSGILLEVPPPWVGGTEGQDHCGCIYTFHYTNTVNMAGLLARGRGFWLKGDLLARGRGFWLKGDLLARGRGFWLMGDAPG